MSAPLLAIDRPRLLSRLAELSAIGATSAGGVHRPALTEPDQRTRRLLVEWGRGRGFTASRDMAGNVFLRRRGIEDGLPPVMIGSHLDSQPYAGRFDGPAGVLAALETAETLQDHGIATRHPIEVVSWTGEEGGARFPVGTLGSSFFAHTRSLDDLRRLTDDKGVTLGAALDELEALLPDVPLRPLGHPIAAYVELHIEQATRLEEAGVPIGVVSTIQGVRQFLVNVTGEAAHAGTTPRPKRRDAVMAAMRMISALDEALAVPEDLRFTIGRFRAAPSAQSVVNGTCEFSVDVRHPDPAVLAAAGDLVPPTCRAHRGPCEAVVRETNRIEPVQGDAAILAAIAEGARRRGYGSLPLVSGAMHDAAHLAAVAPSAMIFIPCEKGISHNEAENVSDDDLVAGAEVLLEVTLALAGAET